MSTSPLRPRAPLAARAALALCLSHLAPPAAAAPGVADALRLPPPAAAPAPRPPCGADPFEPNDARGRARDVGAPLRAARELEGASCGADEDWFLLWLEQGQHVELTLAGDGVERWPPLSAFAPRKRAAQGGVRRALGAQRVKLYARQSGRYRLRVRGRGEERGRYHLSLRELPARAPRPARP